MSDGQTDASVGSHLNPVAFLQLIHHIRAAHVTRKSPNPQCSCGPVLCWGGQHVAGWFVHSCVASCSLCFYFCVYAVTPDNPHSPLLIQLNDSRDGDSAPGESGPGPVPNLDQIITGFSMVLQGSLVPFRPGSPRFVENERWSCSDLMSSRQHQERL